MTLQDLGSIGEFVASLGVIVSLAYLALQMRGNTQALRAQTRSAITDQILHTITSFASVAEHREARKKIRAGEGLEGLTDAEHDVLTREAFAWLRHMENVQYQFEAGLYDESDYVAQRNMWAQRYGQDPVWREVWGNAREQDVFSPRISAVMKEIADGFESGSR